MSQTLFLFRLIPPRADFAQTMTAKEQSAMSEHTRCPVCDAVTWLQIEGERHVAVGCERCGLVVGGIGAVSPAPGSTRRRPAAG